MKKVVANRQSLTDIVPVRVYGIPEMSPYTVDPVKGTVYGYNELKTLKAEWSENYIIMLLLSRKSEDCVDCGLSRKPKLD